MRQLFSKADLQTVSWVLAGILLLSAVPLTSGVVIVSRPSQPEFTMNICQPVQMFGRVTNILLARPAPNVPQFVLFFQGPLTARPAARVVERNVAPDTPPPERLA